jgi:hypothetical protein
MIWLLPHPSHPLRSVNSSGDTQEDRKKQLVDGRGGGGGEGGAKTYDGEKAWSSINHSILFDSIPLNPTK